jgi:hypothetical protein
VVFDSHKFNATYVQSLQITGMSAFGVLTCIVTSQQYGKETMVECVAYL